MTIRICFRNKTNIVLGTDSRVTILHPKGQIPHDGYRKLVQFGDLPIGLAMAGNGAYGDHELESIAAETFEHWAADDGDDRSVENIARWFGKVGGEIARALHPNCNHTPDDREHVGMRVVVAGFSSGETFGEMYEVHLPSGEFINEERIANSPITWEGVTDAVSTLWNGYNPSALWVACVGVAKQSAEHIAKEFGKEEMLEDKSIEEQARGLNGDLQKIVRAQAGWENLAAGEKAPHITGLPTSSAVDLVRFLLDVQIQTDRFLPGRGMCGYPIQLATVSRQGFRWIENPFDA